ncbi:CHC2 zinc finger domain-containing protein [Gottfriedia solisilvae]|uniref:CHC2 zinc finger domain-containing protein n=1 Tax=Gottfriedia solisilvae TaxID=1516104 RepID=UPI003D2ECDD3
MKKFYEPEFIDQLMNEVSFETVLKHYGYPVIGNGKNRGSNCPSCGKNHEHFKINTFMNVSKCYVCNWKGNPIQFIQEVANKSFIQAVEKYAEIGNVELPEQKEVELSKKDQILKHTVEFYAQFSSDYLINRGISQEVIEKYSIGYAEGGVSLKKHLNSLNFTDEELLEVGVVRNRNNGNILDFFYGCVIIPVIQNGKVIDIYGRNTKESNLKHIYLYGEHIAFNLDNINPKLPLIIVESKINALTCITNNAKNVIAVGGSSKFNIKHARQIKSKKIKKVFIAFDTGDLSNGGQEGAIKAGNLLTSTGIESLVVQMPKSTDINEFFLNQSEPQVKFKELILAASPIKEYEAMNILDNLSDEWILNYLKNRKELVAAIS